MEIIKKIRRYSLATIILSFVLGVMLVVDPMELSLIASEILGVLVIAMGIYDLVNYFRTMGYDPFLRGSIVSAVIKLVLGFYIVSHLDTVVAMFGYIFAIYILVTSINSFETSIILKRAHVEGWMMSMILSILVFLAGIAMLFDPFGSAATVAMYAGIVLIVQACSGLYTYIEIKRIKDEVLESLGYKENRKISKD